MYRGEMAARLDDNINRLTRAAAVVLHRCALEMRYPGRVYVVPVRMSCTAQTSIELPSVHAKVWGSRRMHIVVSATPLCRSPPYTSERALSEHPNLTGSGFRER